MSFITEYISLKRSEVGISLKELSKGLCYHTVISKIESDQEYAEKFLIDAILQRLNVEKNNFVHYVCKEDNDLQNLRLEILDSIKKLKLEKASMLSEKYAEKANLNNNLHLQFLRYVVAFIEEKKNIDKMQLADMYKQLIILTTPEFEQKNINSQLLCDVEIYYIFKYIAALRESGSKKWLKLSLQIIGLKKKSALFCMIVGRLMIFVSDELISEGKLSVALSLINKIIEIQRDECVFYYFVDILKIKLSILEKFGGEEDEYTRIGEWVEVLTEFYKDYDIDPNPEYAIEDEVFLWKNCYYINEVIKRRRNTLKMSQEELSEDVCEVKTISRIENNRTSPHPKTAMRLLEKLNLTGDLYSDNVKFKDIETFKLCTETTDLLIFNDFEKTLQNVEILKNKLDLQSKTNRQFISHKEASCKYELKELSLKQFNDELISCLEETVSMTDIYRQTPSFLSAKEIIIISNIMNNYEELKLYENMQKLASVLEEYFASDNLNKMHFSSYCYAFNSLASVFGNIGEFEKSNTISKNLIKESFEMLSCKRVNYLLYEIAYNYGSETGQVTDSEIKILDRQKKKYMKLLKASYIFGDIKKDEYSKSFIMKKINSNVHHDVDDQNYKL